MKKICPIYVKHLHLPWYHWETDPNVINTWIFSHPELLHPYSTSRPLRSFDLGLLYIPRSLLKSKGDCAFAVRAPSLWNSLPSSVRSSESLNVFKKTYQNPSLSSCIPCNRTVIILCTYLYMYVYFILSCLFYFCLFLCLFLIMFYVYCALYSTLQTLFEKSAI